MINEDFTTRSKIRDIGRWNVTSFVAEVANNLPDNATVLDAGAGECVYKRFFDHCNYKAIDLAVGESRWNYTNLDYIGPLHDMPIESGTFDAVLCTQVLEHLEWPRESVREMYRVLKPDGKLYMTVPMAHPVHQAPYDFFRFTSFGIVSICKHSGFQDVKVTPFGGFWVRWAYELPRALSIFPTNDSDNPKCSFTVMVLIPVRLVALVTIRIFQRIFLWLDRFDKKKDDPFGWACVATK
ncbi:class I SAM-dependent methyltransferase [Pelotalea chapellei]|uniref:Methyltransferase domain-containing protein n=1 Tax=Pelotalea chapellei TaxID=44671 RepID=A0ABS5U5N9_9BACT|nr:class I SAM-dependent methyltransferase [Pelotalea chapellei]MBT1070970.1 methyltransferase domain-containing protein [Pelotalea chapellei]